MVPRVPAASSEPTAAVNWVWMLSFNVFSGINVDPK